MFDNSNQTDTTGSLPDPAAQPSVPRRRLAVVTCMDARLDVLGILGLQPGDAHVLRNAGGVISTDIIRSLLISQHLLGTREIVVLHHTDCGMLKFSEAGLRAALRRDLGAEPPFALEPFTDVEDHLRASLTRLRTSPWLSRTDAISGYVYDVHSGRLTALEDAATDRPTRQAA